MGGEEGQLLVGARDLELDGRREAAQHRGDLTRCRRVRCRRLRGGVRGRVSGAAPRKPGEGQGQG